jgi:hypothetical protein
MAALNQGNDVMEGATRTSTAVARSGTVGHLRALVTAACLGVLLLAAGCARIVPYRTQATSASPIDCTPQVVNESGDELGAVDSRCDRLIVEHAAGRKDTGLGPYDLNFIEFDDQGLPFPAIPQFGDASRQIDLSLNSLRQSPIEQSTSLVVFVHGWKHTAQSSDDNVRWFRILLGKLSSVEARSTCKMKVVGALLDGVAQEPVSTRQIPLVTASSPPRSGAGRTPPIASRREVSGSCSDAFDRSRTRAMARGNKRSRIR